MASRVLMPKGSDTMTEGKVLKWLKQEGETVSTGDAVVEIETDKVNMEVEALGAGILRKILVAEGQTVPVGQLLAVLASPQEDISALLQEDGGGKKEEAPAVPAEHLAAGPSAVQVAAGIPSTPPPPATPRPAAVVQPPTRAASAPGRVLASPLARRMAREMGIDLGRVVHRPPQVSAATGPVVLPPREVPPGVSRPAVVPEGPEFHDEPLSSMRKTIATRLAQSLGPIPHFYLTIEADMKRAKELRDSARALDPELKLTYNDIIVKACAAALRAHPEVNASFRGEALRYHNRVHIGLAVAIEGGGLITPVIRDCDRKSLGQISREASEVAGRARSRKLLPDEYTGATFTVSNLGMMGIEEFSAVIDPPQGAILAVGAVGEKPVVVEGRIEAGLRCRMTLSCDHRVVDGATGAKFLQTLKNILEHPVYLAF